MSPLPVDIARTENGLQITWSDDQITRYTARQLRDACPCATCREKRRQNEPDPDGDSKAKKPSLSLTVLSPEETIPLNVLGMKPVGNYAYNINFSDGHSSGLFTFDYLRQIDQTAQ